MITRVISSTSVEIANSAANATGETNNGSLSWVECSPTAQVYPTGITNASGSGAWWNAQGPSILKIPIGTNTVTGAFTRGELVTQTTSGATGAILGVLTDTSGGLGYLVIEPRINGTGSGPRGWSSGLTDTVSAQSAPAGSGATVGSSTGAPIEYVHEVVIWKNNGQSGHTFYQCVDQSGESASRFSQIASSNGAVTNSVAPGGASASFPTPGSWVATGTANSGAASTGFCQFNNNSTTPVIGNIHVIAANCIETATTSQDGSFWVLSGGASFSSSSYFGIGFQRCDDSEDGDVTPYVSVNFTNSGAYLGSRTVQTSTTGSGVYDYFAYSTYLNSGQSVFRGFRRRGFSSGDAFQEFQGYSLAASGALLAANNVATTARIANNPGPTLLYTKEAFWIISSQSGSKMRKGSLRNLVLTEGGVANQLMNGGDWIGATSGTTGVLVGPWDRTSVVSNA